MNNSTSNFTNKYSLDYYLELEYSITLEPDRKEGGYTGIIRELPGCVTQGETKEETIQNLEEARQLWIENAYEKGYKIPLPNSVFGGKVSLRMASTLHRDLAESAEINRISLNQHINNLLQERNSLDKILRELEQIQQTAIEGEKQGNTLVFKHDEIDLIEDGTTVTIRISDDVLTNLEGRRKILKETKGAWKALEEKERLSNKEKTESIK